MGRFSGNLNSLLRYPYGCLEQTVSTAFPQLYFRDLVQLISAKNGAGTSAGTPDYNVQQAIYKVDPSNCTMADSLFGKMAGMPIGGQVPMPLNS
jgi:hypothetical protein